MIQGIDHMALQVADPAQAARDYAAVLGRTAEPIDAGTPPDAFRLQLDNIAVQLHRTHGISDEDARPAPLRLVMRVADLDAAVHRLTRRGLAGTRNATAGTFDLAESATHGPALSLVEQTATAPSDAMADIMGLDHVVIRTPDPERAVALYAGRLGLDLRLDRTNEKFGSRMLFFVVGDLVLEVTHNTKNGQGAGPDQIWGLAWRARDTARAHARMQAGGVTVSEVRDGRRPGTQVFTVKSHTSGVPTLMIGGAGLVRS